MVIDYQDQKAGEAVLKEMRAKPQGPVEFVAPSKEHCEEMVKQFRDLKPSFPALERWKKAHDGHEVMLIDGEYPSFLCKSCNSEIGLPKNPAWVEDDGKTPEVDTYLCDPDVVNHPPH